MRIGLSSPALPWKVGEGLYYRLFFLRGERAEKRNTAHVENSRNYQRSLSFREKRTNDRVEYTGKSKQGKNEGRLAERRDDPAFWGWGTKKNDQRGKHQTSVQKK